MAFGLISPDGVELRNIHRLDTLTYLNVLHSETGGGRFNNIDYSPSMEFWTNNENNTLNGTEGFIFGNCYDSSKNTDLADINSRGQINTIYWRGASNTYKINAKTAVDTVAVQAVIRAVELGKVFFIYYGSEFFPIFPTVPFLKGGFIFLISVKNLPIRQFTHGVAYAKIANTSTFGQIYLESNNKQATKIDYRRFFDHNIHRYNNRGYFTGVCLEQVPANDRPFFITRFGDAVSYLPAVHNITSRHYHPYDGNPAHLTPIRLYPLELEQSDALGKFGLKRFNATATDPVSYLYSDSKDAFKKYYLEENKTKFGEYPKDTWMPTQLAYSYMRLVVNVATRTVNVAEGRGKDAMQKFTSDCNIARQAQAANISTSLIMLEEAKNQAARTHTVQHLMGTKGGFHSETHVTIEALDAKINSLRYELQKLSVMNDMVVSTANAKKIPLPAWIDSAHVDLTPTKRDISNDGVVLPTLVTIDSFTPPPVQATTELSCRERFKQQGFKDRDADPSQAEVAHRIVILTDAQYDDLSHQTDKELVPDADGVYHENKVFAPDEANEARKSGKWSGLQKAAVAIGAVGVVGALAVTAGLIAKNQINKNKMERELANKSRLLQSMKDQKAANEAKKAEQAGMTGVGANDINDYVYTEIDSDASLPDGWEYDD